MKSFFKEDGDLIALLILLMAIILIGGFVGDFLAKSDAEKSGLTIEKLVGNTAENLTAIKRECEKDLPRNRECVLVYDYVPVDKE